MSEEKRQFVSDERNRLLVTTAILISLLHSIDALAFRLKAQDERERGVS